MRWFCRNSCSICLIVVVLATQGSKAHAQQVRSLKRSATPDQWVVSYTLKNSPDDFKFDSIQPSEQAARDRVVALRAWSSHTPLENYEWKLAVILIAAERKDDGPAPKLDEVQPAKPDNLAASEPSNQATASTESASPKPESVAIDSPLFTRFSADVSASDPEKVQKVAGKQGLGSLGTTKVLIEFDGDGVMRIKGPDRKLLSMGTWLQTGTELTFATASYVYVGNVGNEKAKGVRLKNGPRLGSADEEWSLDLTTADPLVGTWQLTSRKEGKYAGDKEEFYQTTLVLRLDHTASVEWTMTSSRKDWNVKERVTDFDRSTAAWEVRDGRIHFSNPKIIRNWRGKDVKWSWFDPANPLNVESLQTWDRIK